MNQEINPTKDQELLIKFKSVASRYKQANIALKESWKKHEKKNNWILKNFDPKQVWDYIDTFQPQYHIDNYTIIDDYTNKKGRTSKAHFNINGKYIGSVYKLGNLPIKVKGWATPSKHYHIIIQTENGCNIQLKI